MLSPPFQVQETNPLVPKPVSLMDSLVCLVSPKEGSRPLQSPTWRPPPHPCNLSTLSQVLGGKTVPSLQPDIDRLFISLAWSG